MKFSLYFILWFYFFTRQVPTDFSTVYLVVNILATDNINFLLFTFILVLYLLTDVHFFFNSLLRARCISKFRSVFIELKCFRVLSDVRVLVLSMCPIYVRKKSSCFVYVNLIMWYRHNVCHWFFFSCSVNTCSVLF